MWLRPNFLPDLMDLANASAAAAAVRSVNYGYKKLSYCWETVRRESMPRIAEMDVEMTT